MDEVVGTLGQAFQWDSPKSNKNPKKVVEKEMNEIEAKVQGKLGSKWPEIRRLAGAKETQHETRRHSLVLLYAHLLRIPVSNSSLKKGLFGPLFMSTVRLKLICDIRANRTFIPSPPHAQCSSHRLHLAQLAFANTCSDAPPRVPHPSVGSWERKAKVRSATRHQKRRSERTRWGFGTPRRIRPDSAGEW